MIKLTFSDDAILIILMAMRKKINSEGFVYDIDTRELTKDVDGKHFKGYQLMGVIGENFITDFSQILTLNERENENINIKGS